MAVDDRFVRMPFEEAIAFLRQKVEVPTDSSSDVTNAQHDAAFVVAGAKGMVLSDLRKAVERAIVDGTRLEDFRQEFDRIVESWEHRGTKAWRARVIYETNIRMAHAAGRYQRQLDPEVMRVRPYLQYIHGGSRDPRPHHIALDGQVFPAGQLPFYPPNGYLCSCRTISLSNRDLSRLGLEVSQIKRGDRIPTKVNGKEVEAVIEPDRGFDFIPGRSPQEWRDQYRQQVLSKLQTPIREQVKASMDEADRQAAPKPAPQPAAPAVPSTTLPPEVVAPPTKIPAIQPKDVGTGKGWRAYQEAGRKRFGSYLNRIDATRTPQQVAAEQRTLMQQVTQGQAQMLAALKRKDYAEVARLQKEVNGLLAQHNAIGQSDGDGLEIMQELRQALIDSARVISPQVAQNLATKFPATQDVFNEFGSEATFRSVLADALQISDGLGLATLKTFVQVDNRAKTNPLAGWLDVGRNRSASRRYAVLFHEVGHHWEHGSHAGKDFNLMFAGRDFIFSKSSATSPVPMSDLDRSYPRNSGEFALPDVSPLSAYVGKDYGIPPGDTTVLTATEVFSSAFEYFSSVEDMLYLYRKDPELFELALGALRR